MSLSVQYSGKSVARPGLKVVQSAICIESCQSDTVGGNHEPYRVYNKALLHTNSTYCRMFVSMARYVLSCISQASEYRVAARVMPVE